jgi:hypothetical protein
LILERRIFGVILGRGWGCSERPEELVTTVILRIFSSKINTKARVGARFVEDFPAETLACNRLNKKEILQLLRKTLKQGVSRSGHAGGGAQGSGGRIPS